MHINLEQQDTHSVQAYTEDSLQIDGAWYSQNLIVNNRSIITDWTAKCIRSLVWDDLLPALEWDPEIILIGHQNPGVFPPTPVVMAASQARIGLETMSIDAACRTYNVLLGEHRNVVLAILRNETAPRKE